MKAKLRVPVTAYLIEHGNSELMSVYLYAYKQTSLEEVIFLHSVVQYNQQAAVLRQCKSLLTVVTRKYSVLL